MGWLIKKRIKMLKANVDVIAMTATPIPRTLQMSLGGVRDMSLIETPPEDRLPVQTYVLEYDPALVRDAIMREIKRGGQVFYVHNRVQTISSTAYHLQGLIPEASFRIAHGQMKEDETGKGNVGFYKPEIRLFGLHDDHREWTGFPQCQHTASRRCRLLWAVTALSTAWTGWSTPIVSPMPILPLMEIRF